MTLSFKNRQEFVDISCAAVGSAPPSQSTAPLNITVRVYELSSDTSSQTRRESSRRIFIPNHNDIVIHIEVSSHQEFFLMTLEDRNLPNHNVIHIKFLRDRNNSS